MEWEWVGVGPGARLDWNSVTLTRGGAFEDNEASGCLVGFRILSSKISVGRNPFRFNYLLRVCGRQSES